LGLTCLPLGEKPDRPIQVQIGVWNPYQEGIGVSYETGQRRDADPLPHCRNLRFEVRRFERSARCASLPLAGPCRHAMATYGDPPGFWAARSPCGQSVGGDVEAS